MWLCLPELCHGSKQQWHVDGGEEVRWTEGDWKKGSGNCTPLFLFFPPYLFCWTAAVLSHLSDRGEPLPGPKHVYLFLIPCCMSPFSSYCSIILPWKLQPTHTHIYHLRTFAHIHTQAHSKTSGYAYYMSPPPLKASLLFFILQLTAEMMRSKLVLALKGCFLSLLQKLQFMAKEGVYCNFKHQYEIQ